MITPNAIKRPLSWRWYFLPGIITITLLTAVSAIPVSELQTVGGAIEFFSMSDTSRGFETDTTRLTKKTLLRAGLKLPVIQSLFSLVALVFFILWMLLPVMSGIPGRRRLAIASLMGTIPVLEPLWWDSPSLLAISSVLYLIHLIATVIAIKMMLSPQPEVQTGALVGLTAAALAIAWNLVRLAIFLLHLGLILIDYTLFTHLDKFFPIVPSYLASSLVLCSAISIWRSSLCQGPDHISTSLMLNSVRHSRFCLVTLAIMTLTVVGLNGVRSYSG